MALAMLRVAILWTVISQGSVEAADLPQILAVALSQDEVEDK